MNQAVNSLSESIISVEKTTHLWRIENFNLLPYDGGFINTIYSPIFVSEKSKNEWKLLVQFGLQDNPEDIDISLISENKADVRVEIELSILNSKNDKFKCLIKSYDFNTSNFTFISKKFITISELTERTDCLQILCEINEFKEINSNLKSIKEININDFNVENSLLNDLKNLLTNVDQSFDIILTCTDGIEVKVHKLILMTRSKFFKSMFKHDTKDKEKTSILMFSEFGDISSDAVKQMVEFLYTDEVNEISKNTQDLLLLSDLYDLPKLKLISENEIIKMINIINCGDLLVLSDICNAENLKKKVLEFFKNQPEIIAKSKDWIENVVRLRPDLYKDTFNTVIKAHFEVKNEISLKQEPVQEI